jgi:hypothetical protein
VTHGVENLRKRNEREIQNTMESQSSRLKQEEDRTSKLEDKMDIKGKTEELLVTQLKTCEKNMQEFTDSIKIPWTWALKKEKRCKQKGFVIYSTK